MFDGIDLKNLNLGDMLNQFQNMAQNAKEENSSRIFTSKAGGGMIEISINGNSEVIDLTDPDKYRKKYTFQQKIKLQRSRLDELKIELDRLGAEVEKLNKSESDKLRETFESYERVTKQ